MKERIIISLLAIFAFVSQALGQYDAVIDEVIGVVGESVILKSDLEKEYSQMRLQYPAYEGNLRCELLSQLVTQKLLLYKAQLDSIEIADEQLEYEINRRIDYFAAQAGSLEALEKYLGSSILEYKEEMRPKIREQLLIQQAQEALTGDVTISPTEVRKFYEEIPEDSMPAFNSEVEIAQIMMEPKASESAERYAMDLAKRLRQELMEGTRDFCLTASLYSADPGSKDECGDLGFFKRGQMVPEFEAAAFKLEKDSISEIVKSKFGFHIIQMLERRGNTLKARHILIKPAIIGKDFARAQEKLAGIRQEIMEGSLDWCKAVNLYSEDQMTSQGCGFFVDPSSGTNKIEVTALPPDVALWIDKLEPGDISEPHGVPQRDGSRMYRIIYLKSEEPPHRANLVQDYQKISVYALEQKKQQTLLDWVESIKTDTYIWIDEKYLNCKEMEKWIAAKK
jgi:peptidyl-prolyl cis-trans isomerase SurA